MPNTNSTGMDTWWSTTSTTSYNTYNTYIRMTRREGGETPPMPTTTNQTNRTPMTEREEAALIELVRPLMRASHVGVRQIAGRIISREQTFDTIEQAIYYLFINRFTHRETDDEVSDAARPSPLPVSYLTAITHAAGAATMAHCSDCGRELTIALQCGSCRGNHRLNHRFTGENPPA